MSNSGGKYMFWGVVIIIASIFVPHYIEKTITDMKTSKENQKFNENLLKQQKEEEKLATERTLKNIQFKKDAQIKKEQAEVIKKESTKAKTGDSEKYYNKARKYQSSKQWNKALREIEKSIEIKPEVKYLQHKAYFLYSLGKYDEMIQFVYQYIDSGELESDYYIYYLTGEAYMKQNKHLLAKAHYSKSVEFNDKYDSAKFGLAKSLIELKSYKKAITYLKDIEFSTSVNTKSVKETLCRAYTLDDDSNGTSKYCK
ncbi:hypothetical protein JXR93_11345 [bacterium]|nr:hypothetical protein [bacterium]